MVRGAPTASRGVRDGRGGLERVAGAQPVQPLALLDERALQRLRQLGVVHGHDPQPGLQLADRHLGPGQFQVNRVKGHTLKQIFPRTRRFLKWVVEKVFGGLVQSSEMASRSFSKKPRETFSGLPVSPPTLRSSDRCSAVRSFGTTIWVTTYWSPRRPERTWGMPLPGRRKVCPYWVAGGIVTLTGPSSVGTSISSPRAAWTMLMRSSKTTSWS